MFKLTIIVILSLGWAITVHSQELLVGGDPRILINGETLETLWEEGGFTEGAAAGPDGNMYFSDFAQPFESGPARVMRFNPNSGKTSVFCPDSGMGNGLMFTRSGELMGCCASPLKGHRALVHFLPDGKFRPYVGAGINYTITYAENAQRSLENILGPTKVTADNSLGWAVQAGFDYELNERWFLNFDVKYITINVDMKLDSGGTIRCIDQGIDPVVIGVGIGYRF